MRLLITALFLFSSVSYAASYEDTVRYLNIYHSDEVAKIIQVVDPKAGVQVQISPKYRTLTLPFSGLPTKDFIISQQNGKPEVEKISVKIFSEYDSVPENVTAEINAIFDWAKVTPEVQFVNSDPVANWNVNYLIRQATRPENVFWGLGFLLSLFLMSFAVFNARMIGGRLTSAVQAAVAELKGGKGNTAGMGHDPAAASNAQDEQKSSGPVGDEANDFNGFGFDSVAALMFDCYWAEKDHYARFIWDRLPVQIKQELVEKHSVLRGYSDYICTLSSTASDLHMNPFYLKPVNLNLKSNDVVRDLVKKNPEFYNNLSPIRKQSISLGPKQSIELSQKEPMKFDDAEKLASGAPDSKPRRLPVQVTINVDSVEEEAEILSIENLPFDIMEKVPSLGWLQRIPEENAKKILGRFSANDIANAWIGPNDVLEFIESLIPDEKMELINSYREKVIPNRGGAMEWIHGMCMDELRMQEAMKENEDKIAS